MGKEPVKEPTTEEILEKYRKAGAVAREARNFGKTLLKENARLFGIAEAIEHYVESHGAKLSFPVNLSINNVAAHYTPAYDDESVLKAGDVVKLDVGTHVDGYIGDTAETVEIETNVYEDMIRASREALNTALSLFRPHCDVGVIGATIEERIKAHGCVPIANLTGHGLERYSLHAGITIPNVGGNHRENLKIGTAIAVEPFATNGRGRVHEGEKGKIYHFVRNKPPKSDDAKKLFEIVTREFKTLPFAERWFYKYVDMNAADVRKALAELMRYAIIRPYPVLFEAKGSIVTQAEHSIIITEDGCEILT